MTHPRAHRRIALLPLLRSVRAGQWRVHLAPSAKGGTRYRRVVCAKVLIYVPKRHSAAAHSFVTHGGHLPGGLSPSLSTSNIFQTRGLVLPSTVRVLSFRYWLELRTAASRLTTLRSLVEVLLLHSIPPRLPSLTFACSVLQWDRQQRKAPTAKEPWPRINLGPWREGHQGCFPSLLS